MDKESRKIKLTQYFNELESDGRDYSKLKRFLMDESDYLIAPASTKYHGAVDGGLFYHSELVSEQLIDFTNKLGLEWSKSTSPRLVGLFHDICKVNVYNKVDRYGKSTWEYSDKSPLGHGEKSVIMILRLFPELTNEEMYCIRWHMGAFDSDTNWNNFTNSIKCYHNVLWTHTADMVASNFYNS